MSHGTAFAPVLNGVPHLGRAEAVLYLILFYVFGHVHPRYQRYIDALAQHERLVTICHRAEAIDAFIGQAWHSDTPRLTWRDTDRPDIYFALLFAWRRVRPRPWAGLVHPALSHQIFPAIEPD